MQVENSIEPIEYSIQCNVRLLPKEIAQFINLQNNLCEYITKNNSKTSVLVPPPLVVNDISSRIHSQYIEFISGP